MNKQALLNQFVNLIQADLEVAKKAALHAYEAAIHEESKPEDPYDTRGLEASYLAGAQSNRAAELEELLAIYRNVDIKEFSKKDIIASTAVIELHSEEGKQTFCLMMPKGGGMSVKFDDKQIQVVTPQSPLGRAMLGKLVGDDIDVRVQNAVREYEIIKVW